MYPARKQALNCGYTRVSIFLQARGVQGSGYRDAVVNTVKREWLAELPQLESAPAE